MSNKYIYFPKPIHILPRMWPRFARSHARPILLGPYGCELPIKEYKTIARHIRDNEDLIAQTNTSILELENERERREAEEMSSENEDSK